MKSTPRAMALVSLFFALGATPAAAPRACAQSNQSGGQQLNPNSSLNSIVNGGSTGVAPPINTVTVPVTPAGGNANAPASVGKDRPLKEPLPVVEAPPKKKLSDRALAKEIQDAIVHDDTLPRESQQVAAAASKGKVTLTGSVLTEDDKYKVAAKAALLVGAENVINLIVVKPAATPP
jgi:hypothetical protein